MSSTILFPGAHAPGYFLAPRWGSGRPWLFPGEFWESSGTVPKLSDALSDGGEHKDLGQVCVGEVSAQDTNLFKGRKGAIHDNHLSLSKTANSSCKIAFLPSQFETKLLDDLFQFYQYFGILHDFSLVKHSLIRGSDDSRG